jgi:hypothetical protein
MRNAMVMIVMRAVRIWRSRRQGRVDRKRRRDATPIFMKLIDKPPDGDCHDAELEGTLELCWVCVGDERGCGPGCCSCENCIVDCGKKLVGKSLSASLDSEALKFKLTKPFKMR